MATSHQGKHYHNEYIDVRLSVFISIESLIDQIWIVDMVALQQGATNIEVINGCSVFSMYYYTIFELKNY